MAFIILNTWCVGFNEKHNSGEGLLKHRADRPRRITSSVNWYYIPNLANRFLFDGKSWRWNTGTGDTSNQNTRISLDYLWLKRGLLSTATSPRFDMHMVFNTVVCGYFKGQKAKFTFADVDRFNAVKVFMDALFYCWAIVGGTSLFTIVNDVCENFWCQRK